MQEQYPTLDLENMREFVTPYMLAILRGQYTTGETLLKSGKVDKYHKNVNGEHVFRMAKRFKLKNVMKYIVTIETGKIDYSKTNFINSNNVAKVNLSSSVPRSPIKETTVFNNNLKTEIGVTNIQNI